MVHGFDPYGAWLGIPNDQRPPHAYALLGLPMDEGNPGTISAAADRQLYRIRPLTQGPQGAIAAQLVGEIEAARRMLLDPHEKARYDQTLRQWADPNGYRRPTPRPGQAPGPAGPLPMGPLPTPYGAPAPSYGAAPGYSPAPGYGSSPGYNSSPAGTNWPMPGPAPTPFAPGPNYSQPYGGHPASYAPTPNYPAYPAAAPTPAPYYPATPTYAAPTYPASAYQPPNPGYAPLTAPPVSPAPLPEKEPEPEFAASEFTPRHSPSEAMVWPWMVVGVGGVVAMGLALMWMMQQNAPPPPAVKGQSVAIAPRRPQPIPALPPIKSAQHAPLILESPRKTDGDSGEAIPIPGVTANATVEPKGVEAKIAKVGPEMQAAPGELVGVNGLDAPMPGATADNPSPMGAMPPSVAAPNTIASATPMTPAGAPMNPEVKPMAVPTAAPMKTAVALAEAPPAVELPSLEEGSTAAAVQIAPVFLGEKQTLQLKLLDGDVAAGQPGARFVLNPAGTADGKHVWQADYVDAENKPQPLGRFSLEDQSLRFVWLAGADANKAQKLRNARLAMEVGQEDRVTALRKAAEVPAFVLNLDGFQTKHTLAGLPEANDLGLEILDQGQGLPDHKFEPSAKVPAGKETDVVFSTGTDKTAGKLRFRFHLSRPSSNTLRIDGRVLADWGKPQALKISNLKQNIEVMRKQKIALDGEYLDLQKQPGQRNRQQMQAATDLYRQRSAAIEADIVRLEDFSKLCDEVNKKAEFHYRVFMKLAGSEVDLVHGAASAMAAK